MFRALYDWTLRLANHRHAVRSLAIVSFCESSFFPVPPDVVLVPVILQHRTRAYRIAAICTIASVLGGMLGYAIGYFLFDTVGKWVIDLYGLQKSAADFQKKFAEYGAVIILLKGLTPIPFKLVTIASGLAKFNFALFVITATITRAFRFFLIAFLLKRYGQPVQDFIEKRLTIIGIAVVVAVVGGFAAVSLL
ncbi:YqaA family protein [Sphingomonas sp. CFBP 13720]|uniref:YqaA family protein n=1 Tax=Sphingomonas sp. CFBP 13720 TaxID=2775302 RepID=UPI001783586F|nr:YqaA family protein [Sphingomonas sp. CFBP 13720]MBD8679442.1 DedA family protein [Sphingomonas sp. CFBP 13720]